jgi:hypothetical protein
LWSHNIDRIIEPRKLQWAGQVAEMEETGNAYRYLEVKPLGKCLFKKPIRIREGNIERSMLDRLWG